MLPRLFLRATLPFRASYIQPSYARPSYAFPGLTGTTALRFNRLNSSGSNSNSGDINKTTGTKAEGTEATSETVTAEGPTATSSTETTATNPSTPTASTTTPRTKWSKPSPDPSRYPISELTKNHPHSEPNPAKPASSNPAERARHVLKTGTVVSAGRMERCVKVAERTQVWDAHIRKFYPKVMTYLVADPRDSLREGDVIQFSSGYRKTKNVRHVVEKILAPFGTPLNERPRVMTYEERQHARHVALKEKYIRKAGREGKVFAEGEKVDVPKPRVGKIKSLVRERLAMIRKRKREERLMREEEKEWEKREHELKKEREGNVV